MEVWEEGGEGGEDLRSSDGVMGEIGMFVVKVTQVGYEILIC